MNTAEKHAHTILRLARLHEHEGAMPSSAKLCADDAQALFDRGDFDGCAVRACTSLRYSVGVLHRDYEKGWNHMRVAAGRGVLP
jgi:hypothetical protein